MRSSEVQASGFADRPSISVLMPVRDAGRTLRGAIRSVLWQTCVDWEMLLLDDGSRDGSAVKAVEDFGDPRIRLVRHADSAGIARRLNEAVPQARGEYIARMDADDIAFPERFELQLTCLRADPRISLVGSGVALFDDRGELHACLEPPISHEELVRRSWTQVLMPHPTWMGRAEWFRANPYPEHARRGQDQCVLFAAKASSRYACVPQVLLGYRGGATSLRKSIVGRWNFVRSVWRHGTIAETVGALGYHTSAVGARALFGPSLALRARQHHRNVPQSLDLRWADLWRQASKGGGF